jgi:beta-glucosidase
MPISYPRYEQSITTYDYKPCEQTDVMEGAYNYDAVVSQQWAFGYGLSYTTYGYANLKADKQTFGPADVLTISVDVTNTGSVAGKEPVLLFSSDLVATSTPDNRRLRAFDRVSLQPGETKTVTFSLPATDLAFVDECGRWVLEAGEFRLQAGNQTLTVTCSETKHFDTPNI